jgi:hypothetical protein
LVTFIAFCFSTQINYVKKEVIFHDYIKFTFKIYYGYL